MTEYLSLRRRLELEIEMKTKMNQSHCYSYNTRRFTMKTKTFLLIFLALLFSLVACNSGTGQANNSEVAASPTEQPTEAPVDLTEEMLKNMTYQGIYDEPVTLTDGLYEGEPFVEGGTSRPTVTLMPFTAFGDLNGDGVADSVVLLVENSGGSGAFVYLAAVLNNEGTQENTATLLLGDRVTPESLAIIDGEMVLEAATHAEDDPMCCPSLKMRTTYALDGQITVVRSEPLTESEATEETTVPDELLGTWYWLAYQDTAGINDITVSDPTKYTLEFLANGMVQIQADCNNASSSITIEGSNLTFASGPMTLAECEPGSLYNEFLAKLGEVASYIFDDADNLVLNLAADAGNMIFARTAEAQPVSELDGTSWVLSGILADSVANSTEIDQEITAVFQDGQLTGFAGCNNYFTSHETDGASLTFGPIGSTAMTCDEAQNQREIEFLTALEAITGYQISNDTLELMDADGNVQILFSVQDETTVSEELLGIWYWLVYQDMAGLNDITVSDPTKYTLEFLANGTVQIQADCNNASSDLTIDGNSLTFAPGPMTLAECDPGSLYNEFLAKLGDVVTYVFDDGGNLVLNLKADAGNMILGREAIQN
jgi:heat shock protein HslJ